jgi:hypothetical protein
MGEAKRQTKTDEIVVIAVIECLRAGHDLNTDEVVAAVAGVRTAANERYVVLAEADEPRRTLQTLYVGAAARFVGRLSPPPDFSKLKGVIVSSAITPVDRGEIVIVAAVETIKRAWSNSGGISLALAYVITKNEDRFTVSSKGGEPMRAVLDLQPGDIARFTGRFSRPYEELPNIELSLVAPIERSGRVEPWRDQWLFISTDRLSPEFRRRVAGCPLRRGCFNCGARIETADQAALVVQNGREFGMVCADCGGLPRAELLQKLSLAKGIELAPVRFVTHAKRAECAIAECCGLDPRTVVRVDADWDYALIEGAT